MEEAQEEGIAMPVRIQRKRTKGWKMPEGAVYVGRPSRFGNRFCVDPARAKDYPDYRANVDLWDKWPVPDAATAVAAFRKMQCGGVLAADVRIFLRGKDLACWCPLCENHKDGKPFGEIGRAHV